MCLCISSGLGGPQLLLSPYRERFTTAGTLEKFLFSLKSSDGMSFPLWQTPGRVERPPQSSGEGWKTSPHPLCAESPFCTSWGYEVLCCGRLGVICPCSQSSVTLEFLVASNKPVLMVHKQKICSKPLAEQQGRTSHFQKMKKNFEPHEGLEI